MAGEHYRSQMHAGERLRTELERVREEQTSGGPGLDRFSSAMADRLAGRLNSEVDPMGFVLATETLRHDCQTGVDSLTGEPMPRELTRQSEVSHRLFHLQVRQLATRAFGQEFGSEVAETYDMLRDSQSGERA